MSVDEAVAAAFREEWGQVVATLIAKTGDWDLAEECAQDAFAVALRRWPDDGVPRKPGAWLTTVARNRAVDRLRRAGVEAARLKDLAAIADDGPPAEDGPPDERLRLMFTCCHPALAPEARVALTLRTLAGLTTAEIARAFLTTEATMQKRLVRAKRKIRDARIPYRVPPAEQLPERVGGILTVLYLLFNEGYAATTGPALLRTDLAEEAIRLARLLVSLMPAEAEAGGLLALMLLHHSRRHARTDANGDLVVLDEQDRSRWDRAAVEEGLAALDTALALGDPGPYQVQAAVAACHATAATAADTDWRRIAELYATLPASPVVRLNRAVAVGMADGPERGLELVAELAAEGALAGHHLLAATRADLLRRLGRHEEAAASYREALALAVNETERRYLRRRLAENSVG